MFYIVDYYTDAVITLTDTVETAMRLSKLYPDSVVQLEDNTPIYWNVDIPF